MAFFGSRISDNLSRTKPENFLVCHDVPIARSGWLDYTSAELGLKNHPHPIVRVYRSPEELFSPGTMASFEGKSVTDQHPPDDLHSANYSAYEKGHVQNVRRGEPLESGDIPLIANLLIKDCTLADMVESGQVREVSIGYQYKVAPYGDRDFQAIDLKGNHVAVVPRGRAGAEVRIRDAAIPIPPPKSRSSSMTQKTLFGRMLKAFATSTDADPDEVAEAAKMGDRGHDEEPDEPEEKSEKKKSGEDRLTKLEDTLNTFIAQYAADKKAHDADEVESAKGEVEEAVEGLIEAVEEEHEASEDAKLGSDSSPEATLVKLREMKPLVAKSGDKALISAYNDTLRAANGGKKSSHDGYKALAKAIATKSADAEAAQVDAKVAEMVAYKALLDAAGNKAAAAYRQ